MANKKRGLKPRSQQAKRGVETVRSKYGSEFYSKIGKKGGEAVRDTRGSQFYSEIGKKGGQSTKRQRKNKYNSNRRLLRTILSEKRASSIFDAEVSAVKTQGDIFYLEIDKRDNKVANAGLDTSSTLIIRITE